MAEDSNSVEEETDVKPAVMPPHAEKDQVEEMKVPLDLMQSSSSPSSEATASTGKGTTEGRSLRSSWWYCLRTGTTAHVFRWFLQQDVLVDMQSATNSWVTNISMMPGSSLTSAQQANHEVGVNIGSAEGYRKLPDTDTSCPMVEKCGERVSPELSDHPTLQLGRTRNPT